MVLPADNGKHCSRTPLLLLLWKFCSFIEVIKYLPEDFISVIKTGLILLYYYKYFLRIFLVHYILSVSFTPLLLLHINGSKNMRTFIS